MAAASQDTTRQGLQIRRERGFFDRSRGVRLFVTAAFVVCLFVFIHFRETRVETLELGSVAPRYIVAQVDMEFYDEEATIILKQEAVRDIGKIYKVADNNIRQVRMEFENYLIYNQEWREEAQQSTFDEIYRGVDFLENTLLGMRLTDPRTLRKMNAVGLDSSNYEIYTPTDLAQLVELPEQVWEAIQGSSFSTTDLDAGSVTFLMRYFKGKEWKLEEGIAAQRVLRKQVQSYVPDKYTKITAGQRIIDQGEKVTARHVSILQAMKKTLSEGRNLWHPGTLFGSILLTGLIVVMAYAYCRINHPDLLTSNRSIFLIVTIVVITLLLSKTYEFFVTTSTTNFADAVRFPLFSPFAAIMLAALMASSIAVFVSGFLAVILSMILPVDVHGFLLTNIAAGLVSVLSTRSLRRRKEIFIVCGQAWLACAVVIVSFHLFENKAWDMLIAADLFSSCVFMIGTAVLVVGLLPLLESSFDIMTDVSLMEYMDPNHDLLRRLTIEAPGTYQHSLVVGNLAEAAALSIGANGLFCRVSTLYHDVGKLATPQYFTENQQGGMNIHQLLTPLESAQVIMAHVSEGVAMARKAGLPEPFIDIIKEHHGTTLVYYFYRKQLEQVDGDESLADEVDFRYAGPKPRSKESAIIMIADTVEAASRSIDQWGEESVTELVESLVRQKAEDGQFDECLLTFEELGIVQRTMIKTLLATGHARIKYPSREKKDSSKDSDRRESLA